VLYSDVANVGSGTRFDYALRPQRLETERDAVSLRAP
jgi:hypothetical protein